MLGRTVLVSTAFFAILCGWFQLVRFSTTAGEQSPAPVLLPADLVPSASQPLLLVFVHPQCSCTAATFEQLDRLLNQATQSVELVLVDTGGRLARRFGAATSGEILLYSPARRLLFQGGITPGRAHAGDSPGSQALLAAIDSGRPTPSTFQNTVFGCPIFRLAHPG